MASLKYIADSTLQTVTLGSAYTAGSGSMTLTTGHGARLPSSGDFWMVYNDGAGTIRIFKVTARSTDTLTVTADATEGSGDGNISSGETLRWGLTIAALTQFRQDISGYGTYANLPATCVIGDQYKTSDSLYQFHATATNTWTPFYRGMPVVIPPTSGWSWVNQGTASVSSTYGCLTLSYPTGGSDNFRLYVRNVPTAPYTLIARIRWTASSNNYFQSGIVLRQSSDGKIILFGPGFNNFVNGNGMAVYALNYDNPTTYNGIRTSGFAIDYTNDIWLKVEDDNTNRKLSVSVDDKETWIQLESAARTNFLTADQIGIFGGAVSNGRIYRARFLEYHLIK